MKKLYLLLGVFALLIFAGSANAQASYNTTYPLWDADCYSGGNYDYGFVNCSTSGNPEQGGLDGNSIHVSNNIYSFYTDQRGLFVFNTSVPAGANITNAEFCGFVEWGFCDQSATYVYPCHVGDLNATQFIPNNLSNPNISDYNSTDISTTKIFMPASLSGTSVPTDYVCINITDWLQNNTINNRNETGIRIAISQYDLSYNANILRLRSHLDSNSSRLPYIYYEWEESIPENETYNLTWITPTNNSIITNTNQISWKISAEETPIYCYLSINGTGNISMSTGGLNCSYTSTSLANGTYCGQVTASDGDETNTSYVQCSTILFSSPSAPPLINNLGAFGFIGAIAIGAGILMFLIDAFLGSATEILRDPKKLVTIIIGAIIMVAVVSVLF